MKNREHIDETPATPESVWAAFRETDKLIKELSAKIDQVSTEIKNVNDTVGGMQNSNGMFAEEYFFNSFNQGNTSFFGEKFNDIEPNVKGIKPGFKDEYDIVLINGKSVAIVEVKYRARLEDVSQVIKKANTFRVNFPDYQNHRVYLGFAALISSQRVEQECIKEGIAVVKQVGDTVIINDKHLKVF